jgi:hypothetical protein
MNLRDFLPPKRGNGNGETHTAAAPQDQPSRYELLRREFEHARERVAHYDHALEQAIEATDSETIISGSIEEIAQLRRTRDEWKDRVASIEAELPFARKADEKRQEIARKNRERERLEQLAVEGTERFEAMVRALRTVAELWREYDAWALANAPLALTLDTERLYRIPPGGSPLSTARQVAEEVANYDEYLQWLGAFRTTEERRAAYPVPDRTRMTFATIDGESPRHRKQPSIAPEIAPVKPKAKWVTEAAAIVRQVR